MGATDTFMYYCSSSFCLLYSWEFFCTFNFKYFVALLRSDIYLWFANNPTFCPISMYFYIHLQHGLLLCHEDNRLLEMLVLLYQTTQHHIPESTLLVMEIPALTLVMVAYNRHSKGFCGNGDEVGGSVILECTGCFCVITYHFIEKYCCMRNICISCCCITVGDTWLS